MHLYVHVPFCSRRCSYCDFAIAVRRSVPSFAFVAAVEREWAMRQQEPGWNGSTGLATVYFGGGTPSRLEPEAIAALIGRFRRDRGIANDAEITLEANPEDVTAENAEGWQSAGVNRVSLGAQSFHPPTLAWMHRTHDAARIGTAVLTLRNAGFDNLSLDLIYGVPDALSRDWDADLDQALGLEPEHLSLYALTIEPLTPLGRWTSRGEAIPAPDDRAADEFLLAHDRLEQSGFDHYEVSNAARPGFRARHNSAYWLRAAFIGLGPSAHSGSGDSRSWNTREWEDYRRRVESGASPREDEERLDLRAVDLEDTYLALRTDRGVSTASVPLHLRQSWLSEGWATEYDGRVRLTPEGWLRLDALVAALPDS